MRMAIDPLTRLIDPQARLMLWRPKWHHPLSVVVVDQPVPEDPKDFLQTAGSPRSDRGRHGRNKRDRIGLLIE